MQRRWAIWYGTEKDTVERVVKRADTALYQSKENGRNQITCEPDWKKNMPPRRPRQKTVEKLAETVRVENGISRLWDR